MIDLVSAFLVGSLVAYLLYLNIKKITDKLDSIENSSFEIYSNFAVKAEEYIRDIKNEIGKKYLLKDEKEKQEIQDKFLEFIQELLFFETVSAKKMTKEEAEEKLFKILSKVDSLLEEKFINGKELADNLREKLEKDFEEIKNEIK